MQVKKISLIGVMLLFFLSGTFAQNKVGDPQPYNETEVDYFYRGVVKEVENIQGIEFGLSLGDLVGDNLDLHVPYKNAIKHAGIPWYNVMGNHDENYDVTADSLSDETFERNFGPANYAFNHGKVHFIVLDDILYPDPRDQKGYWGGFRKDQLDFVENNLKFVSKDKLIVLAFHIPISEKEGNDPFRDADRERLFQILKDFPFILSMSAHTHYQEQVLWAKKTDGFRKPNTTILMWAHPAATGTAANPTRTGCHCPPCVTERPKAMFS
jgi:3',5'-cyclic AMP phosphodiesterase CpdA